PPPEPTARVGGVQPADPRTTPEPTAPVASTDLAGQPAGGLAGGAPKTEGPTLVVLGHQLPATVTGQATGRLGGDGRTTLDLGPALGPTEDGRVGVDHDHGPIGLGLGGQTGRGQLDQ